MKDTRSMKTAPKDGTVILLNVPGYGCNHPFPRDISLGFFALGKWWDNENKPLLHKPTEWSELPIKRKS